ncbi:MAG: hypothetical protein EOL97_06355 [Spirochaetia bacterium]|nr:hypothetical protein [Spirochaetia bacterium]
MKKNIKLTNYRKYMVEKFYSISEEITAEDFCNEYSVEKIHLEDFIEWIELYENAAGKIPLKKQYQIQSCKKTDKKIQSEIDLTKTFKEIRDDLKNKYQLGMIRNFKAMVRDGEFKFSNNEKINYSMCNMYLCDDDPSQIYKLALLLAESLEEHNFRIKDFNRKDNIQPILNNNNKESLIKATSESERIAFVIDPSKMEVEKVGIHE